MSVKKPQGRFFDSHSIEAVARRFKSYWTSKNRRHHHHAENKVGLIVEGMRSHGTTSLLFCYLFVSYFLFYYLHSIAIGRSFPIFLFPFPSQIPFPFFPFPLFPVPDSTAADGDHLETFDSKAKRQCPSVSFRLYQTSCLFILRSKITQCTPVHIHIGSTKCHYSADVIRWVSSNFEVVREVKKLGDVDKGSGPSPSYRPYIS